MRANNLRAKNSTSGLSSHSGGRPTGPSRATCSDWYCENLRDWCQELERRYNPNLWLVTSRLGVDPKYHGSIGRAKRKITQQKAIWYIAEILEEIAAVVGRDIANLEHHRLDTERPHLLQLDPNDFEAMRAKRAGIMRYKRVNPKVPPHDPSVPRSAVLIPPMFYKCEDIERIIRWIDGVLGRDANRVLTVSQANALRDSLNEAHPEAIRRFGTDRAALAKSQDASVFMNICKENAGHLRFIAWIDEQAKERGGRALCARQRTALIGQLMKLA